MTTMPGFLGRQERRALKAQVLGVSPIRLSESELDNKLRGENKVAEYEAAYIAATGASRVGRHDRLKLSLDRVAAPAAPEAPAMPAPSGRRRGRKAPSVPVEAPLGAAESLDTFAPPAGAVGLTQDGLDLDLPAPTQPNAGGLGV